ncbi:hypothetical protein [Ornithinimicrobium pratense]|uniref:WXG100 family type VII secretion target n=1 Tax=Ornithinimicrobium pratense TaxID=2593973 RepID=A0A5J6V2F9_9MICO|nr:hypothetical protein [Ornithinimicrobium pratense]QFG67436.1 hypothetical protein FY030_00695 [Ornithinimicrobium pratense]
MAGAVGGELGTLERLFRTLQNSAEDIQRVSGDIDGALRDAVWTGANSEKFRGAWEEFKPTLTPRLVDALNEAKEDVRIQHNNLAEATGEGARI